MHLEDVKNKQFNYSEIERNFHEIHKIKRKLEGLSDNHGEEECDHSKDSLSIGGDEESCHGRDRSSEHGYHEGGSNSWQIKNPNAINSPGGDQNALEGLNDKIEEYEEIENKKKFSVYKDRSILPTTSIVQLIKQRISFYGLFNLNDQVELTKIKVKKIKYKVNDQLEFMKLQHGVIQK